MKKIIFIKFILLSLYSFSQSKRVADKYFNQYAYPKAVKIYEAIYKKGDSSMYIIKRIADSYYKNAQTEKSELWFSKLISLYKDKITNDDLFKYAQSLRSNGNFTKSDSLLAYIDKESLVGIENETNYLLDKKNNLNKRISIRNLSSNTRFSDFGGFLDVNGDVYFASSAPKGSLNKEKIYKWNNQPFLNLYKAASYVAPLEGTKKDSILELERKVILPYPINTKYHESNAILTKDGMKMYFTRVNYNGRRTRRDKDNTINLKIFQADFNEGKWTNVRELPFNSNDYSVGHPALSNDEKTLYFTSDMPGTIGDSDIFKVSINGDEFGKPKNLGSAINTTQKEMFPFVGSDGTLYFSSNGHRGLGLMDIYQTKKNKDGKYTQISNLGYPFNSNRDDFAFFVDQTGRKGFFSSNRKKGKGDDDIYSFIIYKPEIFKYDLTGIIKDSKSKSGISYATVKILNNSGEVIDEVLTDKKGKYIFKDFTFNNNKFIITVNKSSFKNTFKKISETDKKGNTLNFDISLTPLVVKNQIVINPIYFDFGKYNIRDDAKYELENIVTVMEDNPSFVIKIESHTDSRGDKEYNRLLSDKRAKATRDYIISRGIKKNRIVSAIGYGESKLLNNCDDNSKCTEEEHQLNRRSYFYIVKRSKKDLTAENKNKKRIYNNFKKRKRLLKNKRKSKKNILKLLNRFKRFKSRNQKKDKCGSEDLCK